MAVEWDAPEHHEALSRLRLPVFEPQSDLRPSAVFSLTTDPNGDLVLKGPEQSPVRHSRPDIIETLERRLHLYLATQTRSAVYVHAGVLEWNGAAIVIPGRSFTGKTSLVHALVKAGASFVSDEYAIVDPQGYIHPFPRPISIRGQQPPQRIDAVDLGWKPRAHPLKAALILATRYKAGETWEPRPLSTGGAVLEMLANTVSAQLAPELALQCLSQAVDGAVAWTGDRGEAEETAPLILERLDAASQSMPRPT